MNTNVPTWGIRGALLWGIPPHAGSLGGPRGLIRLYYPTLPDGGYDLINFIAVEPVVLGQKGFSELERSELDAVPGKRLWAIGSDPTKTYYTNLHEGDLGQAKVDGECLRVRLGVERYQNGAHVELQLTQYGSRPDELELVIHALPDSAPMEYCILTATMGNKARARQLWLRDRPVSSLELYPDYRQPDFAPHKLFPLERLLRTPKGEILAAITTNEPDPASVDPAPAARHWRYPGFPVTQYWKKPARVWREDLQVAVNGRFTYWLSTHPIPGGIAFENFEMREEFHEGQCFVFGIARLTPDSLGFDRVPSEPSLSPFTSSDRHSIETSKP